MAIAAPAADLAHARAHWVSADTILWPVPAAPAYRYELHYSAGQPLRLNASGIVGGTALRLSLAPAIPAALLAQFPHLSGSTALTLDQRDLPHVRTMLRCPDALGVR